MPISRHATTAVIGSPSYYSSNQSITNIRSGIKDGSIQYTERTLTGAQRLDTIAGREYGDGRYWWIIAAASDIGWGLQVPAGTSIKVPDLQSALSRVLTT